MALLGSHGETAVDAQQQPKEAESDTRTTICFRNVPNCYDGKKILQLLDATGASRYDFIYVPHDFSRLPNLVSKGYFFVNFVSHDVAREAWEKLNGYNAWTVESSKTLLATWADQTQGFKACVKRYKRLHNPMLFKAVPTECKPMVFENGVLVPLRSTKKNLKQPPVAFEKTDSATGEVIDVSFGSADSSTDAACGMPFGNASEIASGISFGSSSTIQLGMSLRSVSSELANGVSFGSYSSFACDADEESLTDSQEETEAAGSWTHSWTSDRGSQDTGPKPNCCGCNEPFTLFRWRHHCRACGESCCDKCAPLPGCGWRDGLNQTHKQTYKRLCKGCALEPHKLRITHSVKMAST
jgi:hypothetical protein